MLKLPPPPDVVDKVSEEEDREDPADVTIIAADGIKRKKLFGRYI